MTIVFDGVDNEFAVATGSNVDSADGKSTFDNPPSGSKDLQITSIEGDTSPETFNLGDTYDVTWGGSGGGGTILGAKVIRSDPAPGEGGIIVLEGVDDQGNVAQVVWTPGFDLEGWYSANYNPSMEPMFYTTDQDPNYSHAFVCFVAGTRILTEHGLRPVEDLRVGDRVMTCDNGYVPIRWLGHRRVRGDGANAPVVIAPGRLGNEVPLQLSQQHRVLIRSEQAELYFGASEVLVPARALVDGVGATLDPRPSVSYYHILLDRHEILFAEGARCESLLLADVSLGLLSDELSGAMPLLEQRQGHVTARMTLTMQEARLVLGQTGPDVRKARELALI